MKFPVHNVYDLEQSTQNATPNLIPAMDYGGVCPSLRHTSPRILAARDRPLPAILTTCRTYFLPVFTPIRLTDRHVTL